MKKKSDWFTSWFNTPYYHILYKHRDDSDAKLFMQNITAFLNLPKETHILDLACGKGRHSVFLNSLGYKVTGVDLSENSIEYAQKFANDSLLFKVHDMRNSFTNKYDAIFNLFTSFGYFEEDLDDIKILKNIKKGLSKDGVAVIDFLNVSIAKKYLVPYECKSIDGIKFHIHKKIKDNFIIKKISFTIDGKSHSFFEKVKYLDLKKFNTYFKKAGLEIKYIFGDYELSHFEETTSNRLIFVVS